MNKVSSFKRQDRLRFSNDPFGCTAFLRNLSVDAKKIRAIKGYFKEFELFFNKHQHIFTKPSIEIYHIPSKTRLTGHVLDTALAIFPKILKKNIDNGDNVVLPSFSVKDNDYSRKGIYLCAPYIYIDPPKEVAGEGYYKHLFFSFFLKKLKLKGLDIQYGYNFRNIVITYKKVSCNPKNNLGDYLLF